MFIFLEKHSFDSLSMDGKLCSSGEGGTRSGSMYMYVCLHPMIVGVWSITTVLWQLLDCVNHATDKLINLAQFAHEQVGVKIKRCRDAPQA